MRGTDGATEQFFRDGIFRYAEAHATVAAFETAATAKVADAARAHATRLIESGEKVKVDGNNVVNGDENGRIAYAHFPGRHAGQDVVWEIGIWWAHASDGNRVVVYAECWQGPKHLTKEQWATTPQANPEKWLAYKGGLHFKIAPGDDIDEAFKRLFDEVARQSAALAKRSR
jgi:hypothetical protein